MDLHDLPEDLAQFVKQGLAAGKYHSEDELVREAVRSLKEREGISQTNGTNAQMQSVDVVSPEGEHAPEDILSAIKQALATGQARLARHLAMDGAEHYPTHSELQTFAHILAPPTVSRSGRPPRPGIKANRAWLKAHREAYAGCWVALRDGHLLSTAPSFDALVASVDDTTDVLLTKLS